MKKPIVKAEWGSFLFSWGKRHVSISPFHWLDSVWGQEVANEEAGYLATVFKIHLTSKE